MRFEKWQALGNDYAIVEQDELPFELTPERVRAICAPHTGVGADGILLLSKTDERGFVADLHIFNPDGSEAELSGNGVRQAVMYLRRNGWTDNDVVLDPHRRRRGAPADHRRHHVHGRHGPRAAGLREGLPLGRRRWHGHPDGGRARVRLPVRLDRQPAVRDRGRRRARAARPERLRAGHRAPRAVPQPHERVVLAPRRRRRDQRAHLRARGGGDDVVGHRRHRRRGGGRAARRRQPRDRAPRRRRARGGGRGRTCT